MILTNKMKLVFAAILAVAEAIQLALHLGGYWHAGLSAVIVLAGVLGVQAATPREASKQIPVHVALAIGSILSAAEVFQQANVSLPYWVHALIGAAIVVAGALGIQVSGFAVSPAVAKLRAAQPLDPPFGAQSGGASQTLHPASTSGTASGLHASDVGGGGFPAATEAPAATPPKRSHKRKV